MPTKMPSRLSVPGCRHDLQVKVIAALPNMLRPVYLFYSNWTTFCRCRFVLKSPIFLIYTRLEHPYSVIDKPGVYGKRRCRQTGQGSSLGWLTELRVSVNEGCHYFLSSCNRLLSQSVFSSLLRLLLICCPETWDCWDRVSKPCIFNQCVLQYFVLKHRVSKH